MKKRINLILFMVIGLAMFLPLNVFADLDASITLGGKTSILFTRERTRANIKGYSGEPVEVTYTIKEVTDDNLINRYLNYEETSADRDVLMGIAKNNDIAAVYSGKVMSSGNEPSKLSEIESKVTAGKYYLIYSTSSEDTEGSVHLAIYGYTDSDDPENTKAFGIWGILCPLPEEPEEDNPQTADMNLYIYGGILLAGLGLVTVSVRKLREE